MTAIRLQRAVWKYDEARPLGQRGGFGQVFAGMSGDGSPVAVKRLHVTARDTGHRELEMADYLLGRSFAHVMPVLDAGKDAESEAYFVVMPLAEGSLEDELGHRSLPGEVVDVLLAIALGLKEVPGIVHRDLKPANVLRYEGRWTIADFGIARFVAETTATNTLKAYLSPEYASPEQWRRERAESPSDVYSLGCIAYRLLSGRPPFEGPDFQSQHCGAPVPHLDEVDPRIAGLVFTMLRKSPEGRPSAERVISVLQGIAAQPTPSEHDVVAKLRGAARSVLIGQAKLEAEREATAQEAARRAALAADGVSSFQRLCDGLAELLHRADIGGEALSIETGGLRVFAALGDAASLEMTLSPTTAPPIDGMPHSHWDVLSAGIVSVRQKTRTRLDYEATLFFMALPGTGQGYRWYEVSYRDSAALRQRRVGPYAVRLLADADLAAGGGMHTVEIHFGPAAIDGEDSPAFFGRWLECLVTAFEGGLTGV